MSGHQQAGAVALIRFEGAALTDGTLHVQSLRIKNTGLRKTCFDQGPVLIGNVNLVVTPDLVGDLGLLNFGQGDLECFGVTVLQPNGHQGVTLQSRDGKPDHADQNHRAHGCKHSCLRIKGTKFGAERLNRISDCRHAGLRADR